jgi:hypothetical protein
LSDPLVWVRGSADERMPSDSALRVVRGANGADAELAAQWEPTTVVSATRSLARPASRRPRHLKLRMDIDQARDIAFTIAG